MPGDFNDAIEKAADYLRGWLKTYEGKPIQYTRADVYATDAIKDNLDLILALKRPSPDRSEVRERIADTLSSCRDYLQDIVGGATISDRSIVNAIALVDEIDAIIAAGLVPDEAKIRADERRIPVVLFDEIAAAVQVLADTPVSEWNSKAELQSFFRGVAEKFGEVILDRNSPAGRNAT